jgi:translation initiation factor IF-2
VVAVREDRFGRGGNVQQARIAHVDARRLEPARTPIRVTPDASSYVAGNGRAPRPPENTISRAVVATRAPRHEGPRPAEAPRADGGRGAAPRTEGSRNAAGAPPPRIVPAPRPASTGSVPARPTFGNSEVERARPPQPRQFGAPESPAAPSRGNAPRPDGNAPRPDGAQRPDGNAQRPGGDAQRPSANAPRPEANAPRPEVSAPRPEVNAPRPDAGAPRPGGNAPRPDANAPRPGPAPSAPRDVGRGNERPTPPPAQPSARGPQPQPQPQAHPQRLPGEPANRISPQRAGAQRQPEPQQEPHGGGKEPQPGR